MKINTQIQYGVRALCDIVYYSGGSPAQVKYISKRQQISPRYIEQIFQLLKRGGIVKSLRGPLGGYYLARKPEEITVGDVVRAVDGKSIQLVACSGEKRLSRKACARLGNCVTSDVWAEASRRLMDYFDSLSIRQLCEDARARGMEI